MSTFVKIYYNDKNIKRNNLFLSLDLSIELNNFNRGEKGKIVKDDDSYTVFYNYTYDNDPYLPTNKLHIIIDLNKNVFKKEFIDKKIIKDYEDLIKFSSIFILLDFDKNQSSFQNGIYKCSYTFGILNNFSKNYLKEINNTYDEKYYSFIVNNFGKLSAYDYNKEKDKNYINPFVFFTSNNSNIKYYSINKNILKNTESYEFIKFFSDFSYEGKIYNTLQDFGKNNYKLLFNNINEKNSTNFKYEKSPLFNKIIDYKNEMHIDTEYYQNDNYSLNRIAITSKYFNLFDSVIKNPESWQKINEEFTWKIKMIPLDDDLTDWFYLIEFESNNYVTNGLILISKEDIDKSQKIYKNVLFVKKNSNNLLKIGDNKDEDNVFLQGTTVYKNIMIDFYSSKYSGLRLYKSDKYYGLTKNDINKGNNFIIKRLDEKDKTKSVLKYKIDNDTNLIKFDNTFRFSTFELIMKFNTLCDKINSTLSIYNDNGIKNLTEYNGDVSITIKQLNNIFSVAEIKFKLKYDEKTNKIIIDSANNLLSIDTFINTNINKCYANKVGVIGIIPNMNNINNLSNVGDKKTNYIKFCDCIIGTTELKLIDKDGNNYIFGKNYSDKTQLIKHSTCKKSEDTCCAICNNLSGNTVDYLQLTKYMRNLIITNENHIYTIKLLLGNNPDIKYDFEKCFKQEKDNRFLTLTENNDYYKIDDRFLKIDNNNTNNEIKINYLLNPSLTLINQNNDPPNKSLINTYYYNENNGLFSNTNNLILIEKPIERNKILIISSIIFFIFILIFIFIIVGVRKQKEKKLRDEILSDIINTREEQKMQNIKIIKT